MNNQSLKDLREFYNLSEHESKNDYELGILNSAYCLIKSELDTLRIVFDKEIDIHNIIVCNSVYEYNKQSDIKSKLTEKEFNIVKGVYNATITKKEFRKD